MNELETMLSYLRDADAAAVAAARTEPKLSKAVGVLRQQLAEVIEATEALELATSTH